MKTKEILGNSAAQPSCRLNSGGAWIHVLPPAKNSSLVDRDRILLLFPSVPAVHLPVTCKATQQLKQFPILLFSDLPRPLLDLLRCKSAASAHPLLLCSMYWQQGGVLEAGDRA
jgi:hypothetical protein